MVNKHTEQSKWEMNEFTKPNKLLKSCKDKYPRKKEAAHTHSNTHDTRRELICASQPLFLEAEQSRDETRLKQVWNMTLSNYT